MELYDESDFKQKKKTKMPIIIGVSIAVLILISILIIYLIIYLKSTVTTIILDGVNTSELEKIFYIEQSETGSKLYIPIRKIAPYLGYQDFSGDYTYKSEDQTKCHVTNEQETAMFTLDSSTLVKTRGNSDYEFIELDEKVFQKDGELYTTIDGIEKAYNVELVYKPEEKEIDIYTMNYLINYYATRLQLKDYKATFSDQKAIFENMLVLNQSGGAGVINAVTGESILENKYQSVSYLPNTTDFLVKSNGQYGIVSKEAEVKVKIAYEEIKIMDNENGLYLVKDNKFYGVIDTNGNTIIEPEYQQIGINISNFSQNGIESQYILLDKYIPIKSNNLWAFFDLEGNQVTEFEFTGIGCTTSKVSNSYPVLVIPSYEMIVVEKNKYFNLLRTKDSNSGAKAGTVITSGYVIDSVYMRTNTATGENKFYMTYNGNTKDIEERLAEIGE